MFNNKKIALTLSIAVIAILISLPAVAYIIIFHSSPISSNSQQWGEFGSYFGGVTGTIFSGLAFLYIIKSFKIQNMQMHSSDVKSQLFEISETIRFFLKKVDDILSEKIDIPGDGVMSLRTALTALHAQERNIHSTLADVDNIKKPVDDAVTLDQSATLIATLSVLCDLYDEFNNLGGSEKILAAYINSHLEPVLGLFIIESENQRTLEIKRYYFY
jgi:hypothetical protein